MIGIETTRQRKHILAINSGSSSIKFRMYDMPDGVTLLGGRLEWVAGEDARLLYNLRDSDPVMRRVPASDHTAALASILSLLGELRSAGKLSQPDAVGHRVVHGGADFAAPVIIDAEVMLSLEKLDKLAPLHNTACLAGIRAAGELLRGVPQVAVFDTAFHRSLPAHAYYYGLPLALQRQQHIRRYGFHGLSHAYVATATAYWLEKPLADLKLISLHLGNGASACAIHGGFSVDTSMGFTPLEGLLMGSRCGDLDPALPAHIATALELDNEQLELLLQEQSGLLGLCGEADMRRIEERRAAGDADARLAFDIFCYRVRKYIGAYYAVLDGLDALVFTAGIGEHSAAVRAAVCTGMESLGVGIDTVNNTTTERGIIADIGRPDLPVRVLVVPTDEELEIAKATDACLYQGMNASPDSPGRGP